MKKFLKIAGVLFVLFIFGTYIAIEHVLPYAPIKPRRMLAKNNLARFQNKILPSDYGLSGKRIEILTPDSLKLVGYFLKSNQAKAKGNIILLHGIADCKEGQFGRAEFFCDEGYNAIVFDGRAHGESGGDFCTFGFYEKYDVRAVVDFILKNDSNKNIGIWGSSLGGAIALQAMGIDDRIKFGIVESTFDELNNVIRTYGKNLLGINSIWLANTVLKTSGEIAHFNPEEVKPDISAEHIHQPIFFAHGDCDEKIPIAFNKNNFEHCASTHKSFEIVKNAQHQNLWAVGGEEYEIKLAEFLKKFGG